MFSRFSRAPARFPLNQSPKGRVVDMDAKAEPSLWERSLAGGMVPATVGGLVLYFSLNVPLVAQYEQPTWTVSDRPALSIGMVTGPEEYLFQSIAGVVSLSDGRLAVADAGFPVIRVYDGRGHHLHSMGRSGAGPGEFLSLLGIWLTPDGDLAAWDPELRRVVRFDQAGEHVRTAPVVADDMGNLEVFFGRLGGDDILLASLTLGRPRPGEQVPDVWLLHRYDLSNGSAASVGHVQGMWRYERNPVPFSPFPWVATRDDTIYVADGYDPRIEVLDRHGTLVRTLPTPVEQAATRGDWAALERSVRARHSEETLGANWVDLLDRRSVPFDERMPAVAGLLLDDSGLLWVKTFDPSHDALWLKTEARFPAPGGEWYVIDATTGAPVARVEMPVGLVPLTISQHRIVGKHVDPFGVQRVVVHELRRGQRGR